MRDESYTHFSAVSTFLKCRKKWDFAYLERLEPRTRNVKMSFGTLAHAELADLMLGSNVHFPEALSDALVQCAAHEVQEVKDTAQVAQKVARRAFVEFEKRYEVFYLDGKPLVEHTLITEVEGVKFGGTPDCVVKDRKNGGVFVVDWKTRASFLAPESELLNLQAITYQHLLLERGVHTAGTIQVQIKPFLPKEPKLTKDGQVSRAACATDWPTYEAAVLKSGGNPADYEDMKAKLADASFVDMDSCRTLRSEDEVEYFWQEEIVPALREMKARTKPGPGRCFNQMECRGCPYRELCVESAKGGDLEYLKRTLFKIKGEDDELSTAVVMEDE